MKYKQKQIRSFPIILIFIGIILLLSNFNIIENAILKLWPIIFIIIGITNIINYYIE
jgi:membrane-bound ClpP family serine protease